MLIKAYGGHFEIDDEDFELVNKYTWEILYRKNGIVKNVRISKCSRNACGARTYIGRLILDPPFGVVVDHIDGNPLNNHRSNLRICSQHENSLNHRRMYKCATGTVGVRKHRNRWTARICLNNKITHLGTFDTEEEAIRARKKAEKEYYGVFARQED
jgi:predicted RNA methylase